MSNICHVVLNSEHENREKNVKIFFDRLLAIFRLRIFITTLKMYSQTGWADRAETFRIVKGVGKKNFEIFFLIFVFRIQNYMTYVRYQKSCTLPLSD